MCSRGPRYAEADKKFKQRNAELTEEYRRITKQYKELQLKFRHFDLADQEKFKVCVWRGVRTCQRCCCGLYHSGASALMRFCPPTVFSVPAGGVGHA